MKFARFALPHAGRLPWLPAAVLSTLLAGAAHAADGTWITDGDGLWSSGTNWAGGIVADAAGFTADFSTVDLATDRTVSLDSARVLGHLVFGDADPLATPASWVLNNNNIAANTLTLASGSPTITVHDLGTGKSATIGAVINGTAGFTKAGTGTLALTAANTFTGGVAINAGTLALTNSNQVGATNPLTIGAAGRLSTNAGAVTFSNAISGTGILDIASTAEIRFAGDWSGFAGTVNVLTTSGGKLNITGLTGSPDPAAVINVANGATVFASGLTLANNFTVLGTGNSENRGALRLDSGTEISGAVTLLGNATIGNSGVAAATISGVIGDGGSGFGISTAATGAQTIILSGPNTFTGRATLAGQTVFSVAQINNSGEDGNLGRNSTIDFGNATTGGTLVYTGPGETTNRVINLAGTTGGATLTHNGSGQLTFTSDLTATGAGTKTITVQGGGNTEFAGAIVDNSATDTTSLTKAGSGTLTLSGPSPFTGAVNLNGGRLVVAHPNGLGAPESLAANRLINLGASGSGTLELATDSSIAAYRLWGSSNNASTVVSNRATPGAGITHAFGNSGVGNNTVTFAAGPNVISGTAGVSLASLNLAAGSAGTATLNPTSASVTVQGPVNIASNNFAKTLNLGGTGDGNTILGNISNGLNTLTLVKSNTGTWTLAGTNSHTGTTSVTGGILRLDYTTNNTSKLADAAGLTLGGGTIDLAGGSHVESVSSTTLAAATASTVTRSSGGATLQLNSINVGAGASLTFGAPGVATTDNLNTNGILGPWARMNAGGTSDWAVNSTNSADGSVTTFAGYADIDRLGGVVPNNPAAHVRIVEGGGSGPVTLAASPLTAIDSLKIDASGGPVVLAPANATDILRVGGESGGGLWLTAAAGPAAIGTTPGDGILTSGGTPNITAATLTLINDSTTNLLTINSTIANNGDDPVGIAKAGPGTLVLAGSNSFTGPAGASEGTLRLASPGAFGTATAVTVGSAATLDLNGFSRTIGSLATTTGAVVTDNATGGGTTTLSVTGALASALPGLFADGPERALALVLRNNNASHNNLSNPANTFSGGLTLANTTNGTRLVTGTIVPGVYGSGPIIVGEAATDKAGIYVASANQTLANPIVSNTALGTDRVGTFRLDATGFVLTGQLTANLAPMTFSTNGTGAVRATGRITGPNGLTLQSHTQGGTSLTVTLANTGTANDYAGNTIINNNAQTGRSYTLALGAAEQIPNGPGTGDVTINTNGTGVGTLQLAGFNETINGLTGNGTVTSNAGTPTLTVGDNNTTVNFTGVISGSLALTKTGTGAMTLGGATANTYTGVTVLNSGLVTAGKGSAFGAAGAASGTVVNSTATLNTNSQNLGSEPFTLAGGTIRNDGATDQTNTLQRLDVTANSSVGGTRRWDLRGGSLGGLTVAPGVTLAKIDNNLVGVVQNPLVNNGTIRIDAGQFGLHFAVAATGSGSFVVNPAGEFQIGSYGSLVTVANPVEVDGGTLAGVNDGGGAPAFNGPITLAAATTATIRAEAGLVINGAIGGDGGFTKTGGARLTLTNANSHGGPTTVAAGILALSGSGTLAATSLLDVKAGATLDLSAISAASYDLGASAAQTLSGSGTLNAAGKTLALGNLATLAPGASPGTLAVTGNLALASGTLLAWELVGTDQTVGGGLNDLVTVSGDLTLDGILDGSLFASFAAVTGGSWRLFDYGGNLLDNGLALQNMPTLPDGFAFLVDTAMPGQVNLTVIPEPGSLALLAAAAAALWRRTRPKAQDPRS
jgi:autotransporter-associated beta strand protein